MPGLAGLAVAGIFSGSLSTVSSAINSLAGDDDDDDDGDDDYNDDNGSSDPGGLHPALLRQHVRQQGGGARAGMSSIHFNISINNLHYITPSLRCPGADPDIRCCLCGSGLPS